MMPPPPQIIEGGCPLLFLRLCTPYPHVVSPFFNEDEHLLTLVLPWRQSVLGLHCLFNLFFSIFRMFMEISLIRGKLFPRQIFTPYDCLLIPVTFVVLCRVGCFWVIGACLVV